MAGGTRSYEMARRLVAAGHEVHMITSWREPSEGRDWYVSEVEGIVIHWLPVPYSNKMGFLERIKSFFLFAVKSARRAANIKADVVLATSTPLTIALPGAFAAWRQRIPMVFEIRDLWPEVPIALGVLRHPVLKALARCLERFAYWRSSRIVALAPGMADAIVESGVDERLVSIIPNGCDTDLFGSVSVASPPAGREIVYIGTIGPANGVDYIPRLARALLSRYPGLAVRFVVIGDGKCLDEVKALSYELGLNEDQIIFLGALPKKEIPNWLSRARLSIMTYDGPEVLYRDSVSNKFFDSLAAGKPVLANFSGFSTLVAQSAGVGVILPRDDFDLAADQLSELIVADSWLEQCQEGAARLANETFSRDRLAQMLEVVLQQAVSAGPCEPLGVEFRVLWHQARQAKS